ncbi:hypothetical protein [Chelativorans sp. Marseille-P2723]|uniref:hypothetical protein n=1 Tax=Chelativorans sp. Marseille-P2723 TaxID=2709133 RepID=UPI001570065F|nr:hypothetical protein [Chelativorans sp. Marseille-P2723]
MSISFTLSAPQEKPAAPGVDGLQTRLIETLRQQEESIVGDINDALDPSSPLMSLPRPVQELFRRWADHPKYLTPEQARLMDVTKNKIIQLHNDNRDYIRNKVAQNADKIQLEAAVKAVSKIVNGVQQLLSSQ